MVFVVVVVVVLTGTEKGETAWKKIPPPGVPELAGAEQNNSEHPPEKKTWGACNYLRARVPVPRAEDILGKHNFGGFMNF